jgi:hypothetical protein
MGPGPQLPRAEWGAGAVAGVAALGVTWWMGFPFPLAVTLGLVVGFRIIAWAMSVLPAIRSRSPTTDRPAYTVGKVYPLRGFNPVARASIPAPDAPPGAAPGPAPAMADPLPHGPPASSADPPRTVSEPPRIAATPEIFDTVLDAEPRPEEEHVSFHVPGTAGIATLVVHEPVAERGDADDPDPPDTDAPPEPSRLRML